MPQIIISSCVCDSLNKGSQLFSFGFSLTYMIYLSALESMFSLNMSHSQMLGKFEYGGGPIFKVVLEC